ncbi:oligogalacturonate lyase family protein [Paenibacillus sp. TAB 01]|uniref:oligogalacturonate lyase family protein n=1 Tax=Paenibacillus sp. TAB 01 TaxID=3368988 RepID=UPI0037539B32
MIRSRGCSSCLDRGNSTNLYSMHVESGVMTQLTDYIGNDQLDACLLPDESAAFVKLGRKLIRLDLANYDERVMYEAPQGYHLGNVSACADGLHVCTCVQEDLSHRIRLDLGNGYVGHQELMEAAPHSMIVRIDAESGKAETIYEASRFITHINASPKEPWLLTFCHEVTLAFGGSPYLGAGPAYRRSLENPGTVRAGREGGT